MQSNILQNARAVVLEYMHERGQTKGYILAVALITGGALLLGFRVLVPTLSPTLHPLGLAGNLHFALIGLSLYCASMLALLGDDWGNFSVFLIGLFLLATWF
jgi:hypothetical protein